MQEQLERSHGRGNPCKVLSRGKRDPLGFLSGPRRLLRRDWTGAWQEEEQKPGQAAVAGAGVVRTCQLVVGFESGAEQDLWMN